MTEMIIRIVYCETCHDAMLFINGEVVRADRLVSSQIKHENHEGRQVIWTVEQESFESSVKT